MGSRRAAVFLPKAIEHVWKEGRIDASARITHRHCGNRVLRSEARLDAAPFGCEFDGVRQEIPDRLLKPIGIAKDQNRTLLRHHFKSGASGLRTGANHVRRSVDNRRQIDGSQFQPQLASDDPRHVEQVFDELCLRACVSLNGGERLSDTLGFERGVKDHRRPTQNGV
jgi:hypothetical protein